MIRRIGATIVAIVAVLMLGDMGTAFASIVTPPTPSPTPAAITSPSPDPVPSPTLSPTPATTTAPAPVACGAVDNPCYITTQKTTQYTDSQMLDRISNVLVAGFALSIFSVAILVGLKFRGVL